MDNSSQPIENPLAALTYGDSAARLEAIETIVSARLADAATLRALERTAVHAPDLQVRQAAQQALAREPWAAAQRRLREASPNARQFMLNEVAALEQDGLLSAGQAQVLRGRYALTEPAAAAAAPVVPAPVSTATPTAAAPQTGAANPPASAAAGERPPAPSLSQLLLSETSVKIALYLGAFFVVAAAFILAALIEVARLPILGAATVAFFAAALGLARRIPVASFVLFAIGGLMAPIDAGVLAGLLRLDNSAANLYWAGVGGLSGVVWALGVRVYRSRLFSFFAYVSVWLAAFSLGDALTNEDPLLLLLPAVVALVGLAAARFLGDWGGPRLFWPLFLAIHVLHAFVLLISLAVLGDSSAWRFGAWAWRWLVIGTLWGGSALFYWVSDRLAERFERWLPFAIPAVFCAMLAPLFFLNGFRPGTTLLTAAIWGWAVLLSLAAEGLGSPAPPRRQLYPPALFSAAGLLFAAAALRSFDADQTALGIFYLLAAAALWIGLAVRRPRWALWGAALVFIYTAYLAAQSFRVIDNLDVFPGFVVLLPTLVLLGLDLFFRRRGQSRQWSVPPLILGILSAGLTFLVSLTVGLYSRLDEAALTYTLLATGFLVYALIDRRPLIGFLALGLLPWALFFAIVDRLPEYWPAFLIGLAAIFDGLGLALDRRRGPVDPAAERRPWGWPEVLQISGLLLGAGVAAAAPLQGGALSVAAIAVVASLYALEAYRRDWVWLGFPAVGLFFLAYALALWELDVRQPQFYSIAAALLGIVMYHLLARRGHQIPALLTGLLAQLILLSTTYLQMVSGSDFQFFFILFFQALALLIYGLVVRSRSFVVAPVAALVVSVATVALTVLSGLPTALIIGCTGLLLLMLGILALLLRERLALAADRWVGRLERP